MPHRVVGDLPEANVSFEGEETQRRYERFMECIRDKKHSPALLEIGAPIYRLAATGIDRDYILEAAEGKKARIQPRAVRVGVERAGKTRGGRPRSRMAEQPPVRSRARSGRAHALGRPEGRDRCGAGGSWRQLHHSERRGRPCRARYCCCCWPAAPSCVRAAAVALRISSTSSPSVYHMYSLKKSRTSAVV